MYEKRINRYDGNILKAIVQTLDKEDALTVIILSVTSGHQVSFCYGNIGTERELIGYYGILSDNRRRLCVTFERAIQSLSTLLGVRFLYVRNELVVVHIIQGNVLLQCLRSLWGIFVPVFQHVQQVVKRWRALLQIMSVSISFLPFVLYHSFFTSLIS